MKKVFLFLAIAIIATTAKAQFSVGADFVSNYIFRGAVQDSEPAIQPGIEYSSGIFSIGAWGSYSTNFASLQEADLYLSFGLDNGLSFGLTDYYYPTVSFFETEETISTHSFELNAGYETGSFSFAANYILNNSTNTQDGTYYLEAGYAFTDNVSLAVGGGNGWVTATGGDDFQISNIALTVSKEVELTEKFSLPVFGQVILNPNTEMYHLVVGFSL